jgi:hypothetical protein
MTDNVTEVIPVRALAEKLSGLAVDGKTIRSMCAERECIAVRVVTIRSSSMVVPAGEFISMILCYVNIRQAIRRSLIRFHSSQLVAASHRQMKNFVKWG